MSSPPIRQKREYDYSREREREREKRRKRRVAREIYQQVLDDDIARENLNLLDFNQESQEQYLLNLLPAFLQNPQIQTIIQLIDNAHRIRIGAAANGNGNGNQYEFKNASIEIGEFIQDVNAYEEKQTKDLFRLYFQQEGRLDMLETFNLAVDYYDNIYIEDRLGGSGGGSGSGRLKKTKKNKTKTKTKTKRRSLKKGVNKKRHTRK